MIHRYGSCGEPRFGVIPQGFGIRFRVGAWAYYIGWKTNRIKRFVVSLVQELTINFAIAFVAVGCLSLGWWLGGHF